MNQIRCHRPGRCGFSLLEVLVAFAVLAIIMVLLLSITDVTARTWRGVTGKMQAFEDARAAFDRISTLLGQATLKPYWDYDNLTNPTKYERVSELQFLSLPMARMGLDAAKFPAHGLFFQAPTGKVADKSDFGNLPLLLNAYGFFVEYGPDDRPDWLPASVSTRHRFRLKEWRVPSENFSLYGKTSGLGGQGYLGTQSTDWIDLQSPAPKTLAENVIALVIHPKNTLNPATSTPLAEAGSFVYNSRTDGASTEAVQQKHQLPPEVDLIMVAIDEVSAARRWGNAAAAPALAAGLFVQPADLEKDLAELIDRLNAEQIKYILLRSTVKIRGARWSQSL
jgi:uncharacterized protein (TIGR02599 family)